MSRVTSVAIRPMRPEDAGRVAELTTELGYPSTEDEIRRRYGLIINRPDASLFVAHDARNVVVGWVHVQATHLLECDARAEIGDSWSAKSRAEPALVAVWSEPPRSGRCGGGFARWR